jgi:tRNA threonylcarbamoyl adenosine modification protein YeaZ
MKILALEFSSSQRSVAVAHADANGETFVSAEAVESVAPGTNTLGMVEDVLRQARLERHQIEVIVIGLGPGSYNGIRAAIAMAQGWQLALGVKLLGISSAECLAAQAQMQGLRGQISVVIDAQRGEFYLATYSITAEERHEIEPLRIATLAELRAREETGDLLLGPQVTRRFPEGRLMFPRAESLATLGMLRQDFVAGEGLVPIYLRETNFVKAPPSRILS